MLLYFRGGHVMLITPKICVCCDKEFYVPIVATDWAYKKKHCVNHQTRYYWFCSWKCLRTIEKGVTA